MLTMDGSRGQNPAAEGLAKPISVLLGLGGLVLLLACANLANLLLARATGRLKEFSIRLALGATPRNVHTLVFREGFATVALGLTLGLCAAAPLMHALRSFLIGFDSRNSAYTSIAAAVVTVTAGIACWVPARRATKIDPMSALRQE